MITFTSWDAELYHHGILGQKWGRRRWQNEDGSLTEAGIRRYGTKENYERLTNKKKVTEMTDEELKAAIARKNLENEYRTASGGVLLSAAKKLYEIREKEKERQLKEKEIESQKVQSKAAAEKARSDAIRAKAEAKKSTNEKIKSKFSLKSLAKELKATGKTAAQIEAESHKNATAANLTQQQASLKLVEAKADAVSKLFKKNSVWSALTGTSVNGVNKFLTTDRAAAVQSLLEYEITAAGKKKGS